MSNSNTIVANYNGRQPNNNAYIKNFVSGLPSVLWKTIMFNPSGNVTEGLITTASNNYTNLFIPGNLYVNGSIINPSDVYLKDNIKMIDEDLTNKLMNIKPSQFTFKDDPLKKTHYGFIAQEFEKELPELVSLKPDMNIANLKAINYLEILPLLVNKIQLMQKEIDELKNKLDQNIQTK
jgi:hypothetical protein